MKNPVSKPKNGLNTGLFLGAANQIRTGDLVLTKDVLYHLSYNSIFLSYSQRERYYYSAGERVCQQKILIFSLFSRCDRFFFRKEIILYQSH